MVRNRMQQFVKICTPQYDKTTCDTFMVCLWICAGSVGITVLRHFLLNVPQFGEYAAFSWQKVTQSLNWGALKDGALRRGHQSAAHTVGEKRRTCAAFSSAAAARFCILFDVYHIYIYMYTTVLCFSYRL